MTLPWWYVNREMFDIRVYKAKTVYIEVNGKYTLYPEYVL